MTLENGETAHGVSDGDTRTELANGSAQAAAPLKPVSDTQTVSKEPEPAPPKLEKPDISAQAEIPKNAPEIAPSNVRVYYLLFDVH